MGKAEAEEAEDEDDEDDEDFDDDEEGIIDFSEDEDDIFYDDGEEDEDELEARCWARYLKGSQRVYERTLYHIRGRTYRDALMILEFVRWTESKAVLTALQSAAANAQNQKNMDKSRLYISECKAVKGPYEKRFKKVAKGQYPPYRKSKSHIMIKVREMSDAKMAELEGY